MEPEPGTQWPIAPRAIKNSAAAENRPSTTASPSCQVHWEAFSCQNLVSCGTAFEIQGKLHSEDPSKEHKFLGTPARSSPGLGHLAVHERWGTEVRRWGAEGDQSGGLELPVRTRNRHPRSRISHSLGFFPTGLKRLSHWSHYQIIKVSCNRKTNLTLHFKGIWLDRNNTDITLINHFSPIAKAFCNNKLLSHIILQEIIKTSRIPWTDWTEGHKNKIIFIWVCLEIPWVSFLEFESLIQEYSQSHILLSTLYFHYFYRHEQAFSTPHIPFHQI